MRTTAAFQLVVIGMLAITTQATAGPHDGMVQPQSPLSQTPPSGKTSVSDFHPSFELSAPTQLTNANDPSICSLHGGFGAGLACKALLPQGRLALVWDYPARAEVKGFHIYRVDGGQHALVADQDNGASVKAYVVDPPPADGYATACYAVSAFSAAKESALSAPFCGSQARLIQTVTLTPTEWLSVGRKSEITSSSAGMNSTSNQDVVDAAPLVGFEYTTDKRKVVFTVADVAINGIHRLGLHFDVTPILHRKIVSARLLLEVTSAWQGQTNILAPWGQYADVADGVDNPTDHQTSCAAKLAEGTAKWWQYKDWIDASPVGSAAVQGPDVSIDATKIVDSWANYALPNFGLVLIGDDENLNAFTESSCVTRYDPSSFKLVVQYY